MPRKGKRNPNPVRPQLNQLSLDTRSYLVQNRQALMPFRRTITQNPQLRTEFEQLGGFDLVLTSTGDRERRNQLTSEFLGFQNALYLERFLGGNIDRIPTAVELQSEIDEVRKITTDIATELNSCCEEIKSLLNDIKQLIPKDGKETRKLVKDEAIKLFLKIKELFNRLNEFLELKFDQIETNFSNIEIYLKEDLPEEFSALKNFIESQVQLLSDIINETRASIIQSLNIKFAVLETTLGEITATLGVVEVSVLAMEGLLGEVLSAVLGITGELNSLIIAEHVATRRKVNSAATAIENQVRMTENRLKTEVQFIRKGIQDDFEKFRSEINKDFDDRINEIKKEVDENIKDLSEKVATEVSLTIVGESYSKWDSISSYFPTLTFIFNEIGITGIAKRTQIKTRLPKKADELTDNDIQMLEQRIREHENWTYIYGDVRSNFVSSDKRWKTTIFTASEQESKNVLQIIGSIIEETIDFDLLTYTKSGKKRPRITTRNQPLAGVGLNDVSYEREFELKLRKAVLLVNNLKKPIQLYP